MQTINLVSERKDYVCFDLVRCINELDTLCHELSDQDMNEIMVLCNKLHYLVLNKQLNLV